MATELSGLIGAPDVIDLGNFTAGEVPDDLSYTFLQYDGTPLNLTGGTGLSFDFQELTDPAAVAFTATLDGDPTLGRMFYSWGSSDMATPGHYEGQFWVTVGSKIYASLRIRWYVQTAVKAP
jgi:hypothetical protein